MTPLIKKDDVITIPLAGTYVVLEACRNFGEAHKRSQQYFPKASAIIHARQALVVRRQIEEQPERKDLE